MRELFTDEEWETLLLAPFFANHATGMTDDSVVDAFESKALVETVAARMTFAEDELTREVCAAIVSDIETTVRRLGEVAGSVAPADVITAAGRLAERVDAAGYKQLIVDVCEATANASDPQAAPDPAAHDAKLYATSLVREMLDPPARGRE